jgi:N-acetylneuraminic acid mutarotase
VQCKGSIPPARYGHIACVIGPRMFIFGGAGEGCEPLRDIYFLDLQNWMWVPINPTTSSPSPRFGHAHCTVGNKIVIFGGWDGKTVFNDLIVFDTEAFSWIRPQTNGRAPTGRHGHKMEFEGKSGIVSIFGGVTIEKQSQGGKKIVYFNDVTHLDAESMQWRRNRVTGDVPMKRHGHTMTLTTVFDNSEEQPSVDTDEINHAEPKKRQIALVFGGWAGAGLSMPTNVSYMTADGVVLDNVNGPINGQDLEEICTSQALHKLDMDENEWSLMEFQGEEPSPRYGHTMVTLDGMFFLFGGWDGNQALNELYVLETSATVVKED